MPHPMCSSGEGPRYNSRFGSLAPSQCGGTSSSWFWQFCPVQSRFFVPRMVSCHVRAAPHQTLLWSETMWTVQCWLHEASRIRGVIGWGDSSTSAGRYETAIVLACAVEGMDLDGCQVSCECSTGHPSHWSHRSHQGSFTPRPNCRVATGLTCSHQAAEPLLCCNCAVIVLQSCCNSAAVLYQCRAAVCCISAAMVL